jgi:uncharacterized protein
MLEGTLLLSHTTHVLRARRCVGFLERGRGLLFRPPLAQDEALLISPCSSVHMFGMRYPIDVAFVDAMGAVMRVRSKLPPFAVVACRSAAAAWEFAAGACKTFGIEPGVQLSFIPDE